MIHEQAQDTCVTVDLVSCTCSECGTAFGISKHFRACRRRDHKTFYCPNGHNQYFPQKSDVEKLQEEAEAQRQMKQHWQEKARSTEKSLSATKGVLTKTRKRVQNGVCTCCNRHFENLERHMKTKHPKGK